MTILYPLSALSGISCDPNSQPTYWYEGDCVRSGQRLKLPRTALAEAIARQLMQSLATEALFSQEGKMYGILLVETPTGEQGMLKAFSGLLNGGATWEGWVPPILGREQVAFAEAHTLIALESLKQELITLQQIPERQQYQDGLRELERQLQDLAERHRLRKLQRQSDRQKLKETLSEEDLSIALEQLDEQSRRDGIERRHLKKKYDCLLEPLKQIVEQANQQIRELKRQRKALSRQLQAQIHQSYQLINFLGSSASLQQLMPEGLPTGTGECCAPKLLHYAASHVLKPLAMAEFWWGPSPPNGDKISGQFYGACADRCQPLMGFLLSGLSQPSAIAPIDLPILYEDEWLIAVNKPAGLLSVPGRHRDRQDSVLSRLNDAFTSKRSAFAIHRLDQETSGVLLLARDRDTARHVAQQFERRQVQKKYEAVLAGRIQRDWGDRGVIDLPLAADLSDRPRQKVDWQRGKPSLTQFRVIAAEAETTRVEFLPVTGRTHQLRVHAVEGLGTVILGDRLYGCRASVDRLHLHARALTFHHPHSGQVLQLQAELPF